MIKVLVVVMAAVMATFASGSAFAQGAPDPLPERVQSDPNGVDLVTGAFGVSTTDIAIGSLAFGRTYAGTGWRHSTFGTISADGSTYYVSLGNSSDTFTLSGTTYTSDQGRGSTLTYSASNKEYTYTTAGGTVIVFDEELEGTLGPMEMNPGAVCKAIIISITTPSGLKTAYHYRPVTIGADTVNRLQSLTDTIGYQLYFRYFRDSDPTALGAQVTDWRRLKEVQAINNIVDYCGLTVATCTSFTKTWPKVTYTGTNDEPVTVTNPDGLVTTYTHDGSERLSTVKTPGSTVTDLTVTYNGTTGFVSSINRSFAAWNYTFSDSGGNRTATVSLPGGGARVVVSSLTTNLITSDKDPLNRTTSFLYDGSDRLTRVTAPEGNYTTYAYDGRGNVTTITSVAKSGSGLGNAVISTTYASSCSNLVTCNLPITTTDARGFVTDYTYDATHGGVLTVKAPMPATSTVRPETRFTYAQKQARFKSSASTFINGAAIYLLTETSSCATLASCDGGVDESVATIAYPDTSSPNNLAPVLTTAAAGDSSLSTTTSFTYDHLGNSLTIDGPLAGANDTVYFQYEASGRPIGTIGPDPDGAGPLNRPASRTTYNTRGFPYLAEQGTVTSSSADLTTSAFTSFQKSEAVFDIYSRPIKGIVYVGATATIEAVSQTSYDSAGRPECAVLRMNAAQFGALPASACTLGTQGSYGPDRISKTIYDNAGQVTKTISAFGTSLVQDTAIASYTTNGLLQTITDAKGNKTTYEYDGFDRLLKTLFPHKTTTGTSSTTDYEQLNWSDVAATRGLLLTRRGRDARNITFTYDDLSRVTRRHVPGSADGVVSNENYDFTYDSFGRVTTAYHHSVTLAYSYDALGRLTSKAHNGVIPVSYAYNVAGQRTQMTYPDGWAVDYTYDVLGRAKTVVNGTTTLATVNYDAQGRTQSLVYGNGTTRSFTYDAVSRLSSLTLNPNGTADDQTYGFTYNTASQLVGLTSSNSDYDFSHSANFSDAYTVNGLNEYLNVDGATPVYDANGNITTDHRGRAYTYAADNQLMTVKDTGGATLGDYTYYVDGNPRVVDYKRLYYDGDQEIAQYDLTTPFTSGTLERRYVRLPGSVDMPFLMIDYTGTCGSTGCEHWAMQDRRGSVVAVTDENGDIRDRYKYSAYGESGPEGDTGFPFRYTGQKLDAATGLYYYKARYYDPEVGRFLQTDPIGYGDGMNMYAYVGGDPINGSDPSGLSRLRNLTETSQNTNLDGSGGSGYATNDVIIVTATRNTCGVGSQCWADRTNALATIGRSASNPLRATIFEGASVGNPNGSDPGTRQTDPTLTPAQADAIAADIRIGGNRAYIPDSGKAGFYTRYGAAAYVGAILQALQRLHGWEFAVRLFKINKMFGFTDAYTTRQTSDGLLPPVGWIPYDSQLKGSVHSHPGNTSSYDAASPPDAGLLLTDLELGRRGQRHFVVGSSNALCRLYSSRETGTIYKC